MRRRERESSSKSEGVLGVQRTVAAGDCHDQAAVKPRRQPPVAAVATVVKGLETPVWKLVELGSDFKWVGHGLGLFVRSESGESRLGVFQVPRVEPSAIERVF